MPHGSVACTELAAAGTAMDYKQDTSQRLSQPKQQQQQHQQQQQPRRPRPLPLQVEDH